MYWNVPRIVPRSVKRFLGGGVDRSRERDGRRHSSPVVLAREAEIEELGPRARDHHVARLQVAVHDPAPVRAVEGGGDLRAQAQDVFERQPSLLEPLGERLALDQLQHEVVQLAAVHFRGSPTSWSVQMWGWFRRGDALRLAVESRAELGVHGELRGKELQGHVALETGVTGTIDLAHAARAQGHRDLVGAEPSRRPEARPPTRVGHPLAPTRSAGLDVMKVGV